MTTLTITSKGQVTLNKDLLRRMGVGPGDKVEAEVGPDGELAMRAAKSPGVRTIEGLVGSLKRPGQRTISIDEMNEAIARAWAGER